MGWAIAWRPRRRSFPVSGEAASGAVLRCGAAGPRVSVAAAAGPFGLLAVRGLSGPAPPHLSVGREVPVGPRFPLSGQQLRSPCRPREMGPRRPLPAEQAGPGRSLRGCWLPRACFPPHSAPAAWRGRGEACAGLSPVSVRGRGWGGNISWGILVGQGFFQKQGLTSLLIINSCSWIACDDLDLPLFSGSGCPSASHLKYLMSDVSTQIRVPWVSQWG